MSEYPKEAPPWLLDVLGLTPMTTGEIARGLREAERLDIPHKMEAEHAYVMHWLIGLALEHGEHWRPVAAKRIDAALRAIKVQRFSAGAAP